MAEDKTFWPDMGPMRKDWDGRREYQYALIDESASIKYFPADHSWWIMTIHPYDLTEYHYAHSDGGNLWYVCRAVGRRVRLITKTTGDPRQVVAKLRELDKPLRSHIDLS